MRNILRTPFWQAAHRSLPQAVRHRYLADFERAERWDLAIDAAVEALSKEKGALSRLFRTGFKMKIRAAAGDASK